MAEEPTPYQRVFDRRERYIKAVATPGTTDSTALSVLFILCDPIVAAPVTQLKAAVVVNS